MCTSPVGQHHDSGLSEETGLCPVSPSSRSVHEDFGVLQGQLHCHRSDSPQRGVERLGRSGVEAQADCDGMDAGPSVVRLDCERSSGSASGSVRDKGECTSSLVCVPVSGCSSRGL